MCGLAWPWSSAQVFLSWHSRFFVVVCFPSPLLTTSYPQGKVLSSNNCRPPRPPWTFSNPRALRACLHLLTAFQTRPSRSDKNMDKTICLWAHRTKTGRICIAASKPATSLWYVSTLAVNIIQLMGLSDSHRRCYRNGTYHRHWFSSSAGGSRLHLNQLHRCRFPCVPGHVCSRRDGSMASTTIWLYRLRRQIC